MLNFIYYYRLPWIILSIFTWALIIFTCSFRQFIYAMPIGLWTMLVGGLLENFFINAKFWHESFILIPIGELDLFVMLGPFFTIGVILVRYLPKRPVHKLLLVLLLSLLATGIELIAIPLGLLTYAQGKWQSMHSVFAYVLGLMSALGFYFVYYNLPTKTIYKNKK